MLGAPAAGAGARDRLLSSTASTAACTEDIEQQSLPTSGSSDTPAAPEFRIRHLRDLRAGAWQLWRGLLALLAEGVVCIGILDWATHSTSYITYMLVFAITAPAAWIFNKILSHAWEVDREYANVVLTLCANSRRERHLMEALVWQLSKTEGLANRAEAIVERQDDPGGGASYEVELRPMQNKVEFWLDRGTRSHLLEINLRGHEEGGMPGKAELVIRSAGRLELLLSAWARPEVLSRLSEAQDSAREFLHRWLQHIHADYMKTSKGVIEVYELTKEKADEHPSWTRVRQERSVTTNGEGMWHYSCAEWAGQLRNRAEYAIRHRGKTRVTLFLSGPKGSGKTLFVEWLAGELGLPLYNVDLRSPYVTNDVLRDVMTPNRLVHNLPVIFHFDEFQTMIEEWCESRKREGPDPLKPPRSHVTIQGLQQMLEGTSTPNNAIFVFTSSKPMPDVQKVQELAGIEGVHEWRGLLRRFPVQVQIPSMRPADRLDYCRQFLAAYLLQPWDPSIPREQERWTSFEEGWATIPDGVPYDMLAKYAQERTHEAYTRGLMTSLPAGCKVLEECRERYLDAFFEPTHVRQWIDEYAGNSAKQY